MTSIEERVQAAIAPSLAKADLIINELLDGKPLQPAGKRRPETATAGLLDDANHAKGKMQ